MAAPQPSCAKRMECVELAPAFRPPPPYDSASKLDALQTLRVAGHPQESSQLENNFDYCRGKANFPRQWRSPQFYARPCSMTW